MTSSTRMLYIVCIAAAALPATGADSFEDAVRACASLASDSARLACYDKAVAQSRGTAGSADGNPHLSNSSSPTLQVRKSTTVSQSSAAGPAAAAEAVDQFGLTAQAVRERQPADQLPKLKTLSARVATVSHEAGGALIVRLDNGQVWGQAESGPELHLDPGSSVTIDKGVLGAYWLSASTGKTTVKVHRIK